MDINWGVWIPVGIAVIASLTSLLVNERTRRGTVQARREPSWQDLINRLATVEARCEELENTNKIEMGAVARIFRAIADQWHTEDGPNIDPEDLKIISDVVPAKWLRRPPRALTDKETP